jgi:stage II sporulation protein AA (anti-sigma F factor antagonist)
MCAQRDRKPGFDSEFDGITLKIRLRGEIDHHTAAVVRVSMDELIRSRAPRVLAIDMSAVDFMDSSGLGLIMGRLSLMQSIGGETQILDPSPATERIMGLAGMERMLKIKSTKISASDMPELRKRTTPARGGTRRRSGGRGVCSTCGAVAVGTRYGDIGGEAK